MKNVAPCCKDKNCQILIIPPALISFLLGTITFIATSTIGLFITFVFPKSVNWILKVTKIKDSLKILKRVQISIPLFLGIINGGIIGVATFCLSVYIFKKKLAKKTKKLPIFVQIPSRTIENLEELKNYIDKKPNDKNIISIICSMHTILTYNTKDLLLTPKKIENNQFTCKNCKYTDTKYRMFEILKDYNILTLRNKDKNTYTYDLSKNLDDKTILKAINGLIFIEKLSNKKYYLSYDDEKYYYLENLKTLIEESDENIFYNKTIIQKIGSLCYTKDSETLYGGHYLMSYLSDTQIFTRNSKNPKAKIITAITSLINRDKNEDNFSQNSSIDTYIE